MANFDRLFGLFTENKKYSDIKRVKHLNEWSLHEGRDYSNKLERNCELPEGAFADAFRRYLHLNNILYSASGAWENIHFECFFESQDDIDRANAFIDQYDKEGHAPVIDEQSSHIHLDGFGSLGDDSTWRVVDSMSDPTHGKVFLLKFNKPIDTAWDVIVDEDGNIISDHVKNGFDDLNSGVKKATWEEGCSGKKKASKKSTKKSVKEDVDDGSDTIRVLIVEPKKAPMVDNISQSLQSLQKIVGGYIECVYPFEDEVCIICNEEGKIDGLPLNRPLYGDDGQIYDIIAGTFIVAGLDEDGGEFASLDDNLIKKYEKLFHEPFKGYGRYESLKSKNILKKKTSRFVKENRNRITPNKIIDDASLDVEDMFSADNYRGFHIDKDFPVEGMYSVFVEGDDWLFDSIEEARKAIDEYLDAEFSAYTESKKRKRVKEGTVKEKQRYTQSELKQLAKQGLATDITDAEVTSDMYNLEKVGVSFGVNGMNGALLKNRKTGEYYVITARNTNLFRLV